jgi:hypothetical protein
MKARGRVVPVGDVCPVAPRELTWRITDYRMVELPGRLRFGHHATTAFAFLNFLSDVTIDESLSFMNIAHSWRALRDRQQFPYHRSQISGSFITGSVSPKPDHIEWRLDDVIVLKWASVLFGTSLKNG